MLWFFVTLNFVSFHRLGHKGKVDVKLQPGIPTGRGAPGGGCYPDHLPVLAHVPEEANHVARTTPGDLQITLGLKVA